MTLLSKITALGNPVQARSTRRTRSRPWPWWSGFSLCLLLPSANLCFLLSGPHGIGVALAWTLPVWLLIAADHWGPDERRNIPETAPRWFFDGLLYAQAGLQCLNLLAMGGMVNQLGWGDGAALGTALANLLTLRILGGTNACCSVIAPAHELLHRRSPGQRRLGRWLLISVLHVPFHLAHRIGHHARLGDRGDPSTAETGESYGAFFRRSLCSQWCIAWQRHPRALLRGLAAQFVLMAVYGAVFGGMALFMWGYLSWVAVRLLEAVNYFQHYGMTRASGRSAATAWRCDSAVSLFLFLGLTRHADHHRRPWAPYTGLESLDQGPLLPLGYLGMALWVKNASAGFRRWAGRTAALDGTVRPSASHVVTALPGDAGSPGRSVALPPWKEAAG